MKEGHISFKFKSENIMDTVPICGESISVKDLKEEIAKKRNLGRTNEKNKQNKNILIYIITYYNYLFFSYIILLEQV